jgi:hypothetical protein
MNHAALLADPMMPTQQENSVAFFEDLFERFRSPQTRTVTCCLIGGDSTQMRGIQRNEFLPYQR